MISEKEALERAEAWLTNAKASFKERKATVSLTKVYLVVFPPPPDTLGGNFTVIVDANTGNVLDAIIER